jgi:ribosomal protein L36
MDTKIEAGQVVELANWKEKELKTISPDAPIIRRITPMMIINMDERFISA